VWRADYQTRTPELTALRRNCGGPAAVDLLPRACSLAEDLRRQRYQAVRRERPKTDGPGFGLGDVLGTCADGIGSVTTVSGTLGVAYEFETSH